MAIVITLGLHTGCIGSIFVTGIFGNFYTKRGEFLTFKTGIPGGLVSRITYTVLVETLNPAQSNPIRWPWTASTCLSSSFLTAQFSFAFASIDHTIDGYGVTNAQYTPPTPTGRNCFVPSASAVWTHPSAVVTQFTISCADKWRHDDVIV